MRLTVSVVVSAALGYLFASSTFTFAALDFIVLLIGGVLVTGASNGLNQVIERKLDAMMDRTADRPMARGEMSPLEGALISSFAGLLA